MPACGPNYVCTNIGGRQFHMTNKRNSDINNVSPDALGIIRWPYDPTLENTYEITDAVNGHTNRPIRMLRMIIRRHGANGHDFEIRISAYSRANGWQQVSRDNNGGPGPWVETADGPFEIPANPNGPNLGLPRKVMIDPSHDENDFCGMLAFNYGDSGADGVYYYSFDTGASGFSTQIAKRDVFVNPTIGLIERGPYCTEKTDLMTQEREWTCYFPAS